MALKGDRKITDGTDISFYMNNVSERGVLVAFQGSGGSGAAMDTSTAKVVSTGSTSSGMLMAGVLLCDVVNYDLTKQHLNQHKDEVQLGGKVTVCRHGVVVTNAVYTGSTPFAGAPAYAKASTFVDAAGTTNSNVLVFSTTDDDASAKRLGTFLGLKDADGYVKVEVNLP